MLTINIHNNQALVHSQTIPAGTGSSRIIQATPRVNYELRNSQTNYAPDYIVTQRKGRDLHIYTNGIAHSPDVIIEDFYNYTDTGLIGLAENNQYYYYIPDSAEIADYVTNLDNASIQGHALGGMGMISPWWVASITATQASLTPFVIGTLGVAGAGIALKEYARNNQDDTNSHIQPSPPAPNLPSVNQKPTDITLSANTLPENQAGAVVGTLTTIDPDTTDAHTYTVNDTRFEVVNGELKLKAGETINYATEQSINLSIATTDSANNTYSKDLTLQVQDDPNYPVLGTGTILVIGDAQVGTVLNTAISDTDGVPAVGIEYQWFADGKAIAGATHEVYRIRPDDVNKNISVQATYTDLAGNTQSTAITNLAQQVIDNLAQLSALGHKIYTHAQYGKYVDARDFGVNEQNADNSSAIKAALAAADKEGAALYLGTGTLRISEQIRIGTDVIDKNGNLQKAGYDKVTAIFGAGTGKTNIVFDWQQGDGYFNSNSNLDNVNGWAGILIDGVNGKSIADLTLTYRHQSKEDFYRDSDKEADTYFGKINGIVVNDASQTKIDTVEVTGANRAGVYFTSTQAVDSGARTRHIRGEIGEDQLPAGTDNQLIHSNLHHNRVAGALVSYQKNFVADSNHLAWNGHENDGGTGYGIATMAGSYNLGVRYTRNTTDHNYRKGLDIHDGNDIVIENNITNGDRLHGIAVYNRQFTMNDVSIKNNVINADPKFRLETDDTPGYKYHGYSAIQLETNTVGLDLRTTTGKFVIKDNTITGLDYYKEDPQTFGIEFRNHEAVADYALDISGNQLSGDSAVSLIGVFNEPRTRGKTPSGIGFGTINITDNVMDVGKTSGAGNAARAPIYIEEKSDDGKLHGSVNFSNNTLTIRESSGGRVEGIQLVGNAQSYTIHNNTFELHGVMDHSIISAAAHNTDAQRPKMSIHGNTVITDNKDLSRNWISIGKNKNTNQLSIDVSGSDNTHKGKIANIPDTSIVAEPQPGTPPNPPAPNLPPVNQKPTDITLSANTLPENQTGTVVGRLTTVDLDQGDTHTHAVNNRITYLAANHSAGQDGTKNIRGDLDIYVDDNILLGVNNAPEFIREHQNGAALALSGDGLTHDADGVYHNSKHIAYSIGNYQMSDTDQHLYLIGDQDANGSGNATDNTLIGNTHINILNGNDGNDTLDGGYGNDTLTGGQGADTFVFQSKTDGKNIDTIIDFNASEGDKIALSEVIFGSLEGNWFAKEGEVHSTQTRVYQQGNTLYHDPDGTGSHVAQAFAHINDGVSLQEGQFIILQNPLII